MEQDQENWGNFTFTNPNQHKFDNFTYIVHSLIPFNIFVQNKSNLASAIKNLENSNYIVSASLITENFSTLYGSPIGLILHVPKSNFISAGFGDLGIANQRAHDVGYLQEKYKEHGLIAPSIMRDLISKNASFAESMNEVNFINISPSGEKIIVVGLIIDHRWLKNFSADVLTGVSYQDLVQFVTDYANINNVPVIRINEDSNLF